MIKKGVDGTLVAELGKGTLFTAIATSDGYPVGLAFTNNEDGSLGEDSIVIQVTSQEALASYMDLAMRYFKEMIRVSGEVSQEVVNLLVGIQDFQESIKHVLPKKQK